VENTKNVYRYNDKMPEVSLISFLQILCWEDCTATILVRSGQLAGRIYYLKGEIIDATTAASIGMEAFSSICRWIEPRAALLPPEDRVQRINGVSNQILLEAASRLGKEINQQKFIVRALKASHDISASQLPGKNNLPMSDEELVAEILSDCKELKYCAVVNNTGKVIAESSPRKYLHATLKYALFTSGEMQKILSSDEPEYAQLSTPDGQTLLLVPTADRSVALLSETEVSARLLTGKVRDLLNRG
jgi:predicted regulator of Ras-like GTPase activity (Roadblock/LC7/MglB family)